MPSHFIYLFIFVDNQVNFIKQQAGKLATTAIEQTTFNNQITVSGYTTKIDYPYTQVRDNFSATNKPKYKIMQGKTTTYPLGK